MKYPHLKRIPKDMTEKGKLYLIPSPLGENDPKEVIPVPVLESLTGFRTFVVEEIRTARRYLSKAGLKGRSITHHGVVYIVERIKDFYGIKSANRFNPNIRHRIFEGNDTPIAGMMSYDCT